MASTCYYCSDAAENKMILLISRIILTLILIYTFFLVWTKDVNLISWVKNKITKSMPINEQYISNEKFSGLIIDLKPNDSKRTIKIIKREKSISYYLTIPFKNFGDNPIFDFSVIEITSKINNQDNFDFLNLYEKEKSNIPKIILPDQSFGTSLFWTSFTFKEKFRHKRLDTLTNEDYTLIHRQLLHPDNWVKYKLSYISNNKKWLYELKFTFDSKMSEQKIQNGNWPIIFLNQDLKELK